MSFSKKRYDESKKKNKSPVSVTIVPRLGLDAISSLRGPQSTKVPQNLSFLHSPIYLIREKVNGRMKDLTAKEKRNVNFSL